MLDERGKALQYATHLESVYQLHHDGKIDLRKDSDARDAVQRLTHMDSDLGGMLSMALRSYDPRPVKTEFPEFNYADPSGIVPRLSDGKYVGKREIVKQVKTRKGKWANTGEVSRGLGRVDVGHSEIVYGVKYKTASIAYTSQELDQIYGAQQNNYIGLAIDTVRDKKEAVVEAYREVINEVMAFGIPGMDIFGFHNHPNVTRIKFPYRPGATQTPEQNIAAFTYAMGTGLDLSGGLHKFSTVVLDQNADNEMSMQFVGLNADKSVKQYIMENSSIKEFKTTPEAEFASRDRKPVMHFYLRDFDTEGIIAKVMTQIAMPTYENGEWRIHWDAAFSGVHLIRPYKHLILELPY